MKFSMNVYLDSYKQCMVLNFKLIGKRSRLCNMIFGYFTIVT